MIDNFDLQSKINQMRKLGSDTADIEVKSAASDLPKDIVESISAFANKSGGIIVCGISEQDGFRPTQHFDARKISDALAQACSDKMEPPVRADVQIEEFESHLVVVARIPETTPFAKPCYIKARGLYEGSFIRTGDGDRKLSRYEVDRLSEERTQPKYDLQVLESASSSELDSELTAGFLLRERAMSPRVFAGLSDEDALVSMNVLGAGSDGKLHPTLAGLMALGRHPQRHFPRANVTFAVFPGTSKQDISENGARFLDSRTIIGSIPVMVTETVAAIHRNMRIASYVEGAARRDVPEYPEIALREVVANALMHRDYSPEGVASQVQVNMFADRIEVISPGGLFGMVTVDNIGTYGASSSRNQFLSRILESTPFPQDAPESGFVVENKGTGFAQTQAALRQQGLPPAEPVDNLSLFAVVIRKKTESPALLVAPAPARKRSQRFAKQKAILLVLESGSMSTSEIAEALGLSPATVLRQLKDMLGKGEVTKTGKGRATRYMTASR